VSEHRHSEDYMIRNLYVMHKQVRTCVHACVCGCEQLLLLVVVFFA